MIRLYNKNDVESILEIYQPYLLETNITFEEQMPTTTEMAERIDAIMKKFPFLVYIEGTHLLGYCYASEYKPRVAYRWTVEASVYVRQGHHRKNIASKLYHQLFSLLKAQQVQSVIATVSDDDSVLFHRRIGFLDIGTIRFAGFKLGRWTDVTIMQLLLDRWDSSSLRDNAYTRTRRAKEREQRDQREAMADPSLAPHAPHEFVPFPTYLASVQRESKL